MTRPTGPAITCGGSATCSRFQDHYPAWRYRYDLETMLAEIHDAVA